MKIINTLFITICLTGCTSTFTSTEPVPEVKPALNLNQKENWNLMVGKWLGKQPTQEGKERQWIVERYINGSYKITFRTYADNDEFTESTEVGQWAISGPVYMSMFRGYLIGDKISPVDPSEPYNYDAYEIVVLNNTEFKYKSFEYDVIFTQIKVDNNFVFPE